MPTSREPDEASQPTANSERLVSVPGSTLPYRSYGDPTDPALILLMGNTMPGGFWPPRFCAELAATGLHVIRDALFPSVVMYIVVDANAVEFDFPDREGAFSLALPPGEYTFKAFFDGKPAGKPIDGVKVEGKAVDLKEPLVVGGDAK